MERNKRDVERVNVVQHGASPDSVSDPSEGICPGRTTKDGCLVPGSVLSLVKGNGARVHKGPRSGRPPPGLVSFGEPAKMSEHLPTRSSRDEQRRGRGRWGASGPSSGVLFF
ncbi:hypothetical protein MTO96_011589 [Rhipicephalus appendiculatus]